jgi:hypothetical protein
MCSAALCRPLHSALRALAIALPVMGLFTGTIVAAAEVLAWLTDNPFDDVYALATICGLISWLFVAVFHFRQETLTFAFQDRDTFLGRLRGQLKDLGYCAKVSQADRQAFKPSFQALLLGGKIRLRLKDGAAQLDGPRLFLEILRKRLRVQNHLQKDLKIFWDATRRKNERLLKRAQIAMRVTGKAWQGVCQHITEVLRREGANLQCEVVIHAQSEEGIRERLVDGPIRDWLAEKGIGAIITKEPLGAPETGSKLDFSLGAAKDGAAPSLEDTALFIPENKEPVIS